MDGYNPVLDGETVHNDDILDGGPSSRGVRYIYIDEQSVYDRNIALIQENIAARKAREAGAVVSLSM